jgi:hypothetical protein
MTERYGRRWTEQYGAEASPAWRELVNKFTLDDLKAALSRLSQEAPDFPPTLPQFEAILAKAANTKRLDTTDYVRGYWRSVVIREIACNLGYTQNTLEPVIIANRKTLGASMRALLDEFDTLEKRTGQRTEGMLEACRERCIALSDSFPELETAHGFGRVMRENRGGRRHPLAMETAA